MRIAVGKWRIRMFTDTYVTEIGATFYMWQLLHIYVLLHRICCKIWPRNQNNSRTGARFNIWELFWQRFPAVRNQDVILVNQSVIFCFVNVSDQRCSSLNNLAGVEIRQNWPGRGAGCSQLALIYLDYLNSLWLTWIYLNSPWLTWFYLDFLGGVEIRQDWPGRQSRLVIMLSYFVYLSHDQICNPF